MQRREFVKACAAGVVGVTTGSLSALEKLDELPSAERLPALFVGHGSPLNAIEENAFTKEWFELGKTLPTPKAILCISAHWLTRGETRVTAMKKPRTIHDFGGFPKKLFEQEYPAPGSPELAQQTVELVQKTHVKKDNEWGLDHGTWSVLLPMFPKAQFPVVQLSIDYGKPMQYHFDLAREIRKLREKGVLIVGSGNLVHNLRELKMGAAAFDYSIEFEQKMLEAIRAENFQAVVDSASLGEVAKKAHPTPDHFIPLLYSLAVREKGEELATFNEAFDMGSISMTSFTIGAEKRTAGAKPKTEKPDPGGKEN